MAGTHIQSRDSLTHDEVDVTQPFCYSFMWGREAETQRLRERFNGWLMGLSLDDIDRHCRRFARLDRRFVTAFHAVADNRRRAAQRQARIDRGECPNGCYNGWIRHMGSDYPCGACNS